MSEFYCGIDLGGTSAKLALTDPDGTILVEESFKTAEEGAPEIVLPRLVQTIQEMASRFGGKKAEERAILGVGIGAPGLVDIESGVIKFFPNMPTQWRDVPIRQFLSQHLCCSVNVLNDVRTATFGELRFGLGKMLDSPTFAFFSIGTGIGGGVVIDGRLRMGPIGAAGELGHQTILPDGPQCGCGNFGCLEALASGSAIAESGRELLRSGHAPRLAELTGGDAAKVSPRLMAEAAESDGKVAEAIEQAAIYLGIAAANTVVTLHPDHIILGGGVAAMGERLTATVKREITNRVGMFPTQDVTVEVSSLGDRAGIQGAIALAMDAELGSQPNEGR